MSWRLSRSPRKAATRARCGLPMAAAREPPHTASRTRYTPAVGRPSLGPSTPPCCRLLACRRALASSTLLSSPATGRKACTQSNNDSLPSLSSHPPRPPRPPRNQHSTHSSSSRGQRRPWRCLSRHHSSPVRVAVSHQLAHILPRDGSSPRARSLPDGVSGDKPCSSKTVSSQRAEGVCGRSRPTLCCRVASLKGVQDVNQGFKRGLQRPSYRCACTCICWNTVRL